MSGPLRLRIAGLGIELRADGEPDPPLARFAAPEEEAADLVVVSAAAGDERPWPRAGARRFAAGTTWELREHEDDPGALALRWAPGRGEGAVRLEAEVARDWSRCLLLHERLPAGGAALDAARPLLELAFQTRLARLRGGALVHACGLDLGGRGLLLPGSSGRGKSTLAAALPPELALSDERPALAPDPHGRPAVWGTPWRGTAARARPGAAPLAGLAFLGPHAPPFGLRPLRAGEAFRRLCFHAFPPLWDRPGLERVLAELERVVRAVPCVELRWALGEPVLPLLEQACAA